MNLVTRNLPNDNYLWWIYGAGNTEWFWSRFQAGGGFYESQWLTVSHRPVVAANETAIIDLSGHSSYVDPRDADRVTFNLDGQHVILPRGVEYFDSTLHTATEIRWIEHFGSTTDGSLNKLHADVGNHEFNFTTAIKDSSLHLGAGWDSVNLIDHRDIPGTQYWALIRRDDNSLDAYSLLTGRRVRMEDGLESRNGLPGKHNFGEVEILTLDDSRNGGTVVYKPGVDLPTGPNNRGTFTNIDLRSDGQAHSDSFNLAYFNFIRYTSDNVWVGEATIHDGTIWSTPSDRTVDADKSSYLKSGYSYDAPILLGQLSVIGQSRNGTHDLIVAEQANAIDGKLRVYTFNVQSGLYNEFNHVFLGTSADESISKSSITSSNWSDRVALYGFGGNDVLTGGAGRDYLFGGQSVYNQLLGAAGAGNQLTGGTGADYFGVGNTNEFGVVTGSNTIVALDKGDIHQGYATDVIMDWRAQSALTPHDQADTLVVLSNGVAVIGGLRDGNGVVSLSLANVIDLRDYPAVATSDQDFDGARGGDNWDRTQYIDYIYTNQATRDSHSIFNEGDRTVVNEGLIVARGLDGADTIYGSTGNDYLYGNKASNNIHIGNTGSDGNDRIYYDAFDGSFAKHFVSGFTVSNGGANASDEDKFFVNKRVIDAFYSGGSGRMLTTFDSNGEYEKAQAYNPRVNFMHDIFYNPGYASSNQTHSSEDGRAPSVIQGSDGTTFGIGAGMVAAGFAMLFVPFVGAAIAKALFATGAVLGAATMVGSSIIPTDPHKNATFSGNVDAYLNVLTDNNTNNANGVLLRPNTAGNTGINTSVRFLDFFQGADAGDGYLPVVEFTARSGPIYSYFALHSSHHTFVYLVASRDNMVENAEAILVAQINGHLKAEDFAVYDGHEDIYNFNETGEPAVVFVDPTISAVRDSNTDLNPDFDFGYTPGSNGTNASDGLIVAPADAVKSKIVVTGTLGAAVTIDGPNPTHFFRVFDGSRKIYDGNDNSFTNLASLTLTVGGTAFTIVDNRSLGTSARQTDTEVVGEETVLRSTTLDNEFILTDSRVFYTVEIVDRQTGIPTRDSALVVTVKGGGATIDGGGGDDTLTITETSQFLNNATNSQLVSIESILITPSGTTSVSLNLSNQQEGFIITASANGDTIIGGQGANTFNGSVGDDFIVGLAGNDTFNGFLGNDTLIGGGGTDLLRVFGTSASLNDATDAQLQTIEIVQLIIDERQPQFSVSVNGSGVVTEVRVVDPGAGLFDGVYSNVAIIGINGVAANVSFIIQSGSIQIPTNDVAPTNDTELPLGSPLPIPFVAVGSAHSSSATYVLVNSITTSGFGGAVNLAAQSEDLQIQGSQYSDTLIGGSGNDTIVGGAGADRLIGGAGSDTFVYANGAHVAGDTVDGGAGDIDVIRLDVAGAYNFTTATVSNIEKVAVNANAAMTIVLSDNFNANNANVEIVNTTGAAVTSNLTIDGSAFTGGTGAINVSATNFDGNDSIVGGIGNDTINGGAGNDTINGGNGDDIITGGLGADELTGGGGSDTFKYTSHLDSTWSHMDVIKDFVLGASGDKLDLSAIDGAGDVGYSTQLFASLAALTAYATSDLTGLTTGGDDLEVFVGLVSNSSNASENGVYVLARTDDMRNWTTSDTNSTIIKLDGVSSLSGISATNFLGIDNFYNVTTVVIGSSLNSSGLSFVSGGVTNVNSPSGTNWFGSGGDNLGGSGYQNAQVASGWKISGATEVSFSAGGQISVPDGFSSYGDDAVDPNQYEVFIGTYSGGVFTVTGNNANSFSTVGATHTLILYDNDDSHVGDPFWIDGIVMSGVFVESGWALIDPAGPGNNYLTWNA